MRVRFKRGTTLCMKCGSKAGPKEAARVERKKEDEFRASFREWVREVQAGQMAKAVEKKVGSR